MLFGHLEKGKEIMTKYLTPKVRGCPNPTAGGVGGLIQEYGPPGLCQASGEHPTRDAIGLQIQNFYPLQRYPSLAGPTQVVQARVGLQWRGLLFGGPVPSRGTLAALCSCPGVCGGTGEGSTEAGVRVPKRKGVAGVGLRGWCNQEGPRSA